MVAWPLFTLRTECTDRERKKKKRCFVCIEHQRLTSLGIVWRKNGQHFVTKNRAAFHYSFINNIEKEICDA